MANLHFALISQNPNQGDATFTFGEKGGSVGRSVECDWTLEDTERFISNKHIIVSYINNSFLLTDTSSNGAFVNDNSAPLGKGNSHKLSLHDKITMGTFCIQVTDIDETPSHLMASQPSPLVNAGNLNPTSKSDLLDLVSGAQSAPAQPSGIEGAGMASTSTSTSEGADLGLFGILAGEVPVDTGLEPPQSKPPVHSSASPDEPIEQTAPAHNPFASAEQEHRIPDNWDLEDTGQAQPQQTRVEDVPALEQPLQTQPPFTEPVSAAPPPAPAVELSHGADTQLAQTKEPPATQHLETPTKQAAQSESESEHRADSQQQNDDFFALLYAHLGLPKEYMHSVDQKTFARDLTDVLLTSTQGIMALLAGRSVLKQESRLSMTMIKPQSNNPIKFSLDPTDTLEMLLVKKKAGYLSAQAAYSEALNDLQMHQMAFVAGLQAALDGVLNELNPEVIEQQAEERGRGFMDLKSDKRKWEAFVSKQESLRKQVRENLNDMLAKHFSGAYDAHIKNANGNS